MSAEPVVRIVDNRLDVEWPDPLADSYQVSADLLAQFIAQENRRRDYEAALLAIAHDTSDCHAIPVEIARSVLGHKTGSETE